MRPQCGQAAYLILQRFVIYYSDVRYPSVCSGDRELLETISLPAVVCERAELPIAVKCYSGFKLNERPLSFFLHDREFTVMDIEGSWFEEDEAGNTKCTCFRVRADDGDLYLLGYDEGSDSWSLRRIWRLGARS